MTSQKILKFFNNNYYIGYLKYTHLSNKQIQINNLKINKDFRGKNFGYKLMQKLHNKHKSKEFLLYAYQNTNNDNKLIHFYQKLGYIQIPNKTTSFIQYPDNNDIIEIIPMIKKTH